MVVSPKFAEKIRDQALTIGCAATDVGNWSELFFENWQRFLQRRIGPFFADQSGFSLACAHRHGCNPAESEAGVGYQSTIVELNGKTAGDGTNIHLATFRNLVKLS